VSVVDFGSSFLDLSGFLVAVALGFLGASMTG
jgi:hypothetical protein